MLHWWRVNGSPALESFLCTQGCSANKKGVGTHPKKLAISKPIQTHFEAKNEKRGNAVPTCSLPTAPLLSLHH